MQTWIISSNFKKSAKLLDRKRLGAQIYEGIHILSSLLNCNNKLVNSKRNIANHPASKLWKDFESELLYYIYCHLREWLSRGYKTDINLKNYKMLKSRIKLKNNVPYWITNNLIETHKSVLFKKDDYYKGIWQNVNIELNMRYDWRVI